MKEFLAISPKNEVFTPCEYRLVNVGFDLHATDFDALTDRTRSDYFLILVDSGRIIVELSKDNRVVVEKGEFFIYFPNTRQYFWHEGDTKVKKTWVHFMGFECDRIIKTLKITEGKITVKSTSRVYEILQKLLKESVAKVQGFEIMSKSLLLNLLVTLSRDKILDKTLSEEKPISGIMMQIIDIINKRPRISNQELASTLNMSTDHFVRVFKSLFKVTPHQYKLRVIMESAKKCLISSNLTVNQIAELLGYNSDELYFNASFKKFVGVSPTEFRAQNKKED